MGRGWQVSLQYYSSETSASTEDKLTVLETRTNNMLFKDMINFVD